MYITKKFLKDMLALMESTGITELEIPEIHKPRADKGGKHKSKSGEVGSIPGTISEIKFNEQAG